MIEIISSQIVLLIIFLALTEIVDYINVRTTVNIKDNTIPVDCQLKLQQTATRISIYKHGAIDISYYSLSSHLKFPLTPNYSRDLPLHSHVSFNTLDWNFQ